MRGKACARPPGRRAYAGGQARICTGLQRGTPMQDRRHRCTEGIHTRGSRRVRSTDGGEEVQAGRNSTGAQRACPCGAGGGKGAHHAAGRSAGCRAKGLPPAARAFLSGRCFVRRQNAPPPGPSFPALCCKAVPHARAGGAHAAGPPAPGFA